MLASIFRRDIMLAYRHGGGALAGISFYLIVFFLFAFAVPPELFNRIGTGVACVCLLLSIALSLPFLFERDMEDGTLEQYCVEDFAVEWLVAVKLAAHWVSHAIPLLILSPCVAFIMGIDSGLGGFLFRLMLASIAIVAVGGIGAALTLAHRRGALVRAIILLPLSIPAPIFVVSGDGAMPVLLLAAWACVLLPISCFLSALLIRLAQE